MSDPVADTSALHQMMQESWAFGATPAGGVHRLAASATDGAVRDWLCAWFAANGLRSVVDPIGNVAGILDLAGPDAPLVLTGSHLDSQPSGGRYDGAYGVVGACQAALALARSGAKFTHNLAVVSWTSEEGARFQPSLLGSAVHTGLLPLETALAIKDGDGTTLGDALDTIGYRGTGTLARASAYVELHVECGPELEAAGRTLGVVTNWWGAIKLRVSFLGAQSHTGPTPMVRRRDALRAAGILIAAVGDLADTMNSGGPERLYTSVGRIQVEPNSPNVVPGLATLFVELRSPEASILTQAETALAALIEQAASQARVLARVEDRQHRPAGRFDPALVALADTIGAQLGHPPMHLPTIAAHDAIPMTTQCPSVVVLTPSAGGMCHHEAEFTAPEDLECGLHLLTGMLWQLCIR